MRTTLTFAAVAALLSQAIAITIISPFPGTNIDPSQPISITWIASASDPSTIDLKIDDSSPNALSTNQVLAAGVKTSSGSFTVPANAIQNWGTGYQIQATGSGGDVLGTVGDLTLGAGSNAVTTASNGQISLITSATAAEASSTVAAPATGVTSAPAGTTGSVETGSGSVVAATAASTVLSGSFTAVSTSASGSQSSTSTKSSGFVTSSTSRTATESSEASAAATSAANTNTANSLGRMRGGEVVMGAAGVLAGIVALIV